MIGVGLVGIGTIARAQHLPAIAETAGMQLVATASRNARVEGVSGFADVAAMLTGAPGVTAVSLATPPQGRFDQAMAALAAGRHVMLEKPPGATLSEVIALLAQAEDRRLTLFATWHAREAAAVGAARDWITGRDLASIRIDWREDVHKWHPGQEWIWQPGGLGVLDPGINALSILTALVPDVVLTGADLHIPQGRATPIAAELMLRSGGIAIAAQFDWRETQGETWRIAITDAGGETAVLDQGGARLVLNGATVAQGENREYPGLYARFRDLIAAGACDVDLAPMQLVADAFLTGRRHSAAPFND